MIRNSVFEGLRESWLAESQLWMRVRVEDREKGGGRFSGGEGDIELGIVSIEMIGETRGSQEVG